MAYRRRGRYQRRNGRYMRRNRGYGRLYAGRNRRTGGYVGRDMKRIDKLLNGDIAPGTIVVDAAPLNGMAIGSGEQQRIGNQCDLYSCRVFGTIGGGNVDNSTLNQTSNCYTVMLVLDTQANGAIFTQANLFETAAGGTLGLRHWEFISRFKILAQQKIWCNTRASANTTTTQHWQEETKQINLSYKFNPPLKCRYKNTGGDISDIQDYAIILVIRQIGNPTAYTKESSYATFSRAIYTG